MLIGATSAYLDKNKDQVIKVARALDEACKMIKADPSKAGTATHAEAKIPAAIAEAQFREIDCEVRDFTDQDLANYREMALFLNEKGVTKSRADVEKFTQKGFYK
jgi:NitT/TauT family transport system substrate-binding protein